MYCSVKRKAPGCTSWWHYRSTSCFFDFQLWERLVDVQRYWQNCSRLCNYIFDFSGRLALLSRKKKRLWGEEFVQRSERRRLKGDESNVDWDFFYAAECTAKLGHIQATGGWGSKLAIFLFSWELGEAVIPTLSLTVRQVWLDAGEVHTPIWPAHPKEKVGGWLQRLTC